MSTAPRGDRIVEAAWSQGRPGLRRHLAWQVFGVVGMVALGVGAAVLTLIPALHLLVAPTVPATVEYDAPGGRVFAAVELEDGRVARGAVGGDTSEVTIPVRWNGDRPELMARSTRLRFDLPFGLVLTGAFVVGAIASGRSVRLHAGALRRLRDDLDPVTRDQRRMRLSTELHRTRTGLWTTVLLTEPGDAAPRWKTRFFMRAFPEMTDVEVTVHGRLADRGYAVIESDDGELLALHEPLLRPLGWRRSKPASGT